MASVVDVRALDDTGHVAVEAGGLASGVVAVGAGGFFGLEFFMARYARSQVLLAIGTAGVGAALMRIMAVCAFDFAQAGTTIHFERLQ
jgi:hypothetical protein